MALQCNIDARGKLVRLINGIALIIIGVALVVFWAVWAQGGVIAWVVSIMLIAGGAFAIFEARAGWCAIRAMGFKTPL